MEALKNLRGEIEYHETLRQPIEARLGMALLSCKKNGVNPDVLEMRDNAHAREYLAVDEQLKSLDNMIMNKKAYADMLSKHIDADLGFREFSAEQISNTFNKKGSPSKDCGYVRAVYGGIKPAAAKKGEW